MHMSRSSMGDVGGEPAEPHRDRIDLVAAPTAIREAMDWTAQRLAQANPPHDRHLIDAAVLVVCELVKNAVRAVSQPPAPLSAGTLAAMPTSAAVISLDVTGTGQSVRIEVHDQSRVPTTPTGSGAAEDQAWQGLITVDALATAWGWRPSPYGRTMWCVLDDGVVRAAGLADRDP